MSVPRRDQLEDPLFDGEGEARELCRRVDWRATPAGPSASWAPMVRASVRLCLDSKTPSACWLGPALTLVYNDAYASILGKKHPGAMGRPMKEVWSEVFEVLAPLVARVAGGQAVREENAPFRLRRASHEEVAYFTYSLTPIRDEDGSVHGIFNVAEESTHTVRSRIESDEFLYFALATAGVGAWELNLVDNTARRSLEHDRIFGYHELLPQWTFEMFLEHVVPEDREGVERRFREAVGTGGEWRFECRIRRHDGELRWISAAGRHRTGKDGQLRMSGLVQDISERKRAEEQLRDSDRRKDEYLAMLGHELRNPLAAIRNSTELFKIIGTDDRRLVRALGVLERQTIHMARLIDGLLDVSRVARGKIDLVRQPLDLAEVIRGVLEDHETQRQARGLTLHEELPAAPLWVVGDRVRLTQVFDNLIGNALKFTAAPGSISVELFDEGDEVIARVRDTGVGVRPEMLATIFEPFRQETQSIARTAGGLGLGLALAKALVELHQGTILAHSEGPGRGTELEVRLPRSDAPPPARSPQKAPEAPARRILIVEDNTDAAESLRDLLEHAGHTVHIVREGAEALEVLRRHPTDVVLCDLGLPGMSGYDVAAAVRGQPELAGLRLIAVSGYGQPDDRRRSTAAGFDEHLVKPVERAALERALFGARSAP